MARGGMTFESREDIAYATSFLKPGSPYAGTLASILEQITSEEERSEFCRHFKLRNPLVRSKAILSEAPSVEST